MTVSLLVWLLACLSVACCDVCVLPRADGDEFFSTQPQGVQEELCNRIDGDCVSLNVSDIGVLPGYNASVTCPACKCINNGSFHPSTLQCFPPMQCSRSVGFEPFQATGELQNTQAQQNLILNKTFSCYGRVTGWKLRVRNPATSGWILMQVWRHVGEYFQQVGMNQIDVTQTNTSGFTDVVYSVDESEQILFRPGDFIGVFIVDGTRALPYAINRFKSNPPASVMYSYHLINSDYPPTQLAVTDVTRVFFKVIANVAALTGPLLSTDVECIEEATPSTETTPSSVTSTPSTHSPLNNTDDENATSHITTEPGLQTIATTTFLGVIIACATALFLLVLLLCTGVIVLSVYCARKRKRAESIQKATLPQPPLNSCSQEAEHIYDTIPANTPHFYDILEGPTLESDYHGLEDSEGDEDACDKLQNCQDVFERNDSMKPRKETWVGPTDTTSTDTGTNVKEESGNFSEDVTIRDQSENDFDEDYISDFEP